MTSRALTFATLLASLWSSAFAADDYTFGPDSQVQEGVPQGLIEEGTFDSPNVYKGTTRKYWVYIPQQYDGSNPACVIVVQDGGNYLKKDGQCRATTVFDNLIAKGDMPVTVGIFVDPGVYPSEREGREPRRNRSVEYDTLSDAYATFIIDEVLPHVSETYDLKLTDDPEQRAICGISSGGICAFTVAWERPDAFRKVVSHVGSFTNIRGGDVYPGIIRKAEKRPIRVFLQDGENDLDNAHGNWPLANQQMAKALAFAAYDYKFEYGDGGHNMKHGGAIFPDTLRWLWRDWKEAD
ncbi:MAG: esterase family protein [Planctomycetaceae bacterium]|nr:esterase family protein [Planctomycetaceae bacterium]